MRKTCTAAVTHIGEKGYVYCAEHAVLRRRSGAERTRKMLPWELKLVEQGTPLPNYRPIPLSHMHRGVAILPADRNSSGIRWTARLDDGTRLRADTLLGLRQLINNTLKDTE